MVHCSALLRSGRYPSYWNPFYVVQNFRDPKIIYSIVNSTWFLSFSLSLLTVLPSSKNYDYIVKESLSSEYLGEDVYHGPERFIQTWILSIEENQESIDVFQLFKFFYHISYMYGVSPWRISLAYYKNK